MITSTFNLASGVMMLHTNGDLLSSNSEAAAQAFEVALTQNPKYKALWVDCTSSKMIDSVGLNLLFNVLTQAKERKAGTKIIIAKGGLERILQAAQIAMMFPVEVRARG